MNILIIGSDSRSAELAEILIKKGYNTRLSTECEGIFDALILPLPLTRDSEHVSGTSVTLSEIIEKSRGKAVFYGGAPKRFCDSLCAKCALDYNASELFQYSNARLTVEGALAIAVESTRVSIFGSDIAIIGFGRIAKLLAHALHDLGAGVHIYARRDSDIAYALSLGYGAEYIKDGLDLGKTDLVFNTAPVPLLAKSDIEELTCPLIDLAPISGLNGERIISAPALPSRYSPRSAALAVYRSIIHKLKEV